MVKVLLWNIFIYRGLILKIEFGVDLHLYTLDWEYITKIKIGKASFYFSVMLAAFGQQQA